MVGAVAAVARPSDAVLLPAASVDWSTIAVLTLGVLLLAALLLQEVGNDRRFSTSGNAEALALKKFQWVYLPPFLLATFADWIQGPYQYKVYTAYGFDEHDIGRLYICGFGSSLLFGTYIAAAADTYGRKSNCLLYCLVYSLSCLTKNSPNYHHLMFGRVLGGLATSILFASFESWCITAYRAQRLESGGLDEVFTNIAFANALTAIVSSLFGDFLVTVTGSLIAPFNFVPVVLTCSALLIATTWTENYGYTSSNKSQDSGVQSMQPDLLAGDHVGSGKAGENGSTDEGEFRDSNESGENVSSIDVRVGAASAFLRAARTVVADRRLFLLGMMGALVEATLYVFIFLWTPALEIGSSGSDGGRREVRHGVVFGAFMTWNMVGAQLCKLVLGRSGAGKPENLITIVIAASIVALLLPVRRAFSVRACHSPCHCCLDVLRSFVLVTTLYSRQTEQVVTSNFGVLIGGFCAFEAAIGAYWPLVMKLRSHHLGEAQRAAVTSLFRVPLNVVVCLVLMRAGWLSLAQEFSLCVGFLIVALVCQRLVVRRNKSLLWKLVCYNCHTVLKLNVWMYARAQARALNMPMSPGARSRRGMSSDQGSSTTVLLVPKVPSGDTDVHNSDVFTRSTESTKRSAVGGSEY